MSVQARGKWREAEDNIIVGEVVIIHEDNLPRVEEVDVGADGKVRVAAIRTANGIFRRPIHKLAPLPIDVAEH